MTAVMSRSTVAPVLTVAVDRVPEFRVTVHESDQVSAVVVLRNVAEVAMALNQSGAHVGQDMAVDELARLTVAGVRRVGMARVRELALVDRMANLLDVYEVAPSMTPEVAALQRAIWSSKRERACTDAAEALVHAAKQGDGLKVGA